MDPKEFAQAYDRKPKAVSFFDYPELEPLIQPFDDWSTILGEELVLAMNGEPRQLDATTFMTTYLSHMNRENAISSIRPINAVMHDAEPSERFRVLQAHNFNVMSQVLAFTWLEMLYDEKLGPEDRAMSTTSSRIALSNIAIIYAKQRAAMTTIESDYKFFSPEMAEERAHNLGVVTELDTAITLLEITRRNPDIIFVPAPKQFEDTNAAANVDFIVCRRSTQQIVGVQAKTRVHDTDRAKYDGERVVLIDGVSHLGNEVMTRTTPGKSDAYGVSWPGLIAASVIDGMKLHGKGSRGAELYDQKSLFRLKNEANVLLKPRYDTRGKLTGNLNRAVHAVTKEIAPFLAA